jgi:hypothetical protein
LISTRLPIRLEPGDEANIYVGLKQPQRAMTTRTDRRIQALSGSSTAGMQWSRAIEIPSEAALEVRRKRMGRSPMTNN